MARTRKGIRGMIETTRGFGATALADEFGGTFIEQDGRGDGSLASSEFTPEVAEDDERVFGDDPLRRFTPLEEVPAIGRLAGQRWANHARNARL